MTKPKEFIIWTEWTELNEGTLLLYLKLRTKLDNLSKQVGDWGTELHWTDGNPFWTFIENTLKVHELFLSTVRQMKAFFASKQMVQIIVSICGSIWWSFSIHSTILFSAPHYVCYFNGVFALHPPTRTPYHPIILKIQKLFPEIYGF